MKGFSDFHHHQCAYLGFGGKAFRAYGNWTIDVRREDENGLYRYQLPNGKLRFRKAKALGVMTDMHALGKLDQLPHGARVTFVWEKD